MYVCVYIKLPLKKTQTFNFLSVHMISFDIGLLCDSLMYVLDWFIMRVEMEVKIIIDLSVYIRGCLSFEHFANTLKKALCRNVCVETFS